MAERDATSREIPISPSALDSWVLDELTTDDAPDERRDQLRAALVDALRELVSTRLTDRQRRIVELYFFQGRTQQDIAHELGISQQVVSRQLFGVMRDGKKVGGAIKRLRDVCAELGLEWV